MNVFRRHIRRMTRRQKAVAVLIGIVLVLLFWFALIMGPFRTFFWNMPALAGLLGQQKYLVLLQNESELRPTGGFISAYGVITMTFGFPSVSFHDSYQISSARYVEPPYPFRELIGQDPFYAGWQFRDANFSPDFRASVKQILDFYEMQHPNERFAGVIALDFNVIEDLLRVVGDVEAGGMRFTPHNLFVNIQRASKNIDLHDEEALKNRKNIVSDFAGKLVSRALLSPARYGQILDAIEENLQKKHMQIVFSSPALQKKIQKRGWDGSIEAVPGSDFLHVNVANIGGRKADRYVQKRYEYTVTFPMGGPGRAVLTQTFTHQGDYNLQSDRYQAYVRTYVPRGSRLLKHRVDATDKVQQGNEFGADYFGNTIVMMPGERKMLIYEYELPSDIRAENYLLSLHKQAGTMDDDYLVTVRMPNDHMVDDAGSDQPFIIRENVAVWRGLLKRDLTLRLQKQPDTMPPIVLWQRFRSPNTIEIRWNEDINKGSINSLAGFSMTDLNYADNERENIVIKKASIVGKDLLLDIEGIRHVTGERYSLTLRNISDLSGNMTVPNPLEITVVYRIP